MNLTAAILAALVELLGGLAIIGGRALLRVVPLDWVRRAAAVAFGVIAIVTALEAGDVM